MRKLLAAAAAVSVLAGACQPSAPATGTTGQPAVPQPSGPSGKLVVAVASTLITSLETGAGNDAQTLQFMWPAFDGLTWLSADGKINPGLAKEWRLVNETTWEFKLGEYKFQNGRAVDAQDVVDTFARYQDPDKKLPNRVVFTGAGVTSVTAPDTRTVRIVTAKPNPTLPNIIQLPMVLPMKELNAAGDQAFFKSPIGSGPFRVTLSDFPNQIRYTAMGSEHPTPRGTAKIKDLEIKIVPEISARVAGLRTGDIDLALALNVDQAGPLETAGFKLFNTNGTSTIQYSLDTFNGPTTNVKVRQAINYAIDKEIVLRSFYGGKGRVDTAQLVGPAVLGFNPSLQAYPLDRNKAKALLAEAGYAQGFRIKLVTVQLSTVNKDLAQIIADQLKEVGITVDIEVKETAIWLQDFYGSADRRPGMFVQPINFDQTFEPDSVYRWFSSDVANDAGRRWTDPEFDRLYVAAKTEMDRTKRGQAYQLAAKYLNENAPVLFGWQINGVFAGKKNVTVGQPAHAMFYVEATVS